MKDVLPNLRIVREARIFLMIEESQPSFSGWVVQPGIAEYDEDTYCVGMSFNQMKDDETKKEFLDRIEKTLIEVFGKAERPEVMLDGGYDG